MNAPFRFVLQHGYSFLFGVMFAHQIGIPIPGPLILLSAGALTAAGKMGVVAVLSITVTACVLADWIWFEAGRCQGEKVLHFLHRLTTRDPDFHDRRAKRTFARYGLALLLVAKFVPGLDAVAPPLAAIAQTGRLRFLAWDAAGAALYGCVYGGLGYACSHDLDRVTAYVSHAGRLLVDLVLVTLCLYITYQLFQRRHAFRNSQALRGAQVDPVEYGDPARIIGGQENGD